MPKVLILLSGGLDSSIMLDYYLDKGYEVYYVYINIGNNKEKTELELEAIDKVISYLKSVHTNGRVIEAGSVNIKYNGSFNSLLPMPALLHQVLGTYMSKEYDHAAIGYILGDNAPVMSGELRSIFTNTARVASYDPNYNPVLEYPIIHKCNFNKEDVIKYVKSSRPELLEITHWCEAPHLCSDGRPSCKPCRTYINAKSIVDNQEEINHAYRIRENVTPRDHGPESSEPDQGSTTIS